MRPSSIDRQPEPIREAIGSLRSAGFTIDQIRAVLDEEHGVDVSRSALGRHIKKLDRLRERLAESRQISEALVARMGDATENKQLRLLVELIGASMFDALSSSDEAQLDAESQMFLARATKDLSTALRNDADYVERQRQAAADKARAETAEQAVKIARDAGLSADALATFTSRVLGIRSEAKP